MTLQHRRQLMVAVLKWDEGQWPIAQPRQGRILLPKRGVSQVSGHWTFSSGFSSPQSSSQSFTIAVSIIACSKYHAYNGSNSTNLKTSYLFTNYSLYLRWKGKDMRNYFTYFIGYLFILYIYNFNSYFFLSKASYLHNIFSSLSRNLLTIYQINFVIDLLKDFPFPWFQQRMEKYEIEKNIIKTLQVVFVLFHK